MTAFLFFMFGFNTTVRPNHLLSFSHLPFLSMSGVDGREDIQASMSSRFHIYAGSVVFANREVIADGLNPLTVSQTPSENSNSAIGRTPIPVSR